MVKYKRMLAVLLSVMMITSYMPAIAFAAAEDESEQTEVVTEKDAGSVETGEENSDKNTGEEVIPEAKAESSEEKLTAESDEEGASGGEAAAGDTNQEVTEEQGSGETGDEGDEPVNSDTRVVESWSFSKKDGADLQIEEGTNGYMYEDEDGNSYFIYEYNTEDLFTDGDTVTIKYEGEANALTYTYYEWDEENGFEMEFVRETDNGWDKLNYDEFSIAVVQNEAWNEGDTGCKFVLTFRDVESDLPFEIIENHVKTLAFEREGYDAETSPIELMHDVDGSRDEDGTFYYYLTLCEGDKLILNDDDIYTLEWSEKDEENIFINENNEVIREYDIIENSNGPDDAWEPGDKKTITLTYNGVSCDVAVMITENPVKGIEFHRDTEPIELIGWYDEEVGESWYYLQFEEGDCFYIKYSDNEEDPLIEYVASNGEEELVFLPADEFINNLPEGIPASIPESAIDRYAPGEDGTMSWEDGGVYDYCIEYMGKTCIFPVKAITLARPVSMAWTYAGGQEKVRGIIGTSYIYGDDFYNEGNELVITFDDNTTQTYICKNIEQDENNVYTGYFLNGDTSGGTSSDFSDMHTEVVGDDGICDENAVFSDGDNQFYIIANINSADVAAGPFDAVGIANPDQHEHDWSAPTYTWGENEFANQVTAYRVCSICGEEETETVDGSVETDPETYAETVTAEFQNEAFETQVIVREHVHDWLEPDYQWADDYSSCTATRICSRDASHVETETAEAVLVLADDGINYTATATFRNPAFEEQSVYTGHAHNLQHFEAVPANCIQSGNHEYWYCDICGGYFSDENGENQVTWEDLALPLDEDGHDWGEVRYEWGDDYSYVHAVRICNNTPAHVDSAAGQISYSVIKEATEKEEGEGLYTAVFDEDWAETQTQSVTIPVLEHSHSLTHVEAKDSTCTEPGNTEYWYCDGCGKYFSDAEGADEIEEDSWVISALGHLESLPPVRENVVEATCTESGSYDEVVYCVKCHEELSRETITVDALGHSWDEGTVTKEATETEEGIRTYTCTVCGETKTETIPKTVHVHSLTPTAARAATCTEDGNSAYWTCSGCGKYFSDENGENEITPESWVIPASGHSLVHREYEGSTCTVAGHDEYWECTECGNLFKDQYGEEEITYSSVELPLDENAHDWGDWFSVGEYEHKRVCSHNENHAEYEEHAWGEEVIAQEPTINEEGIKTKTCTVCGETVTETIDRLPIWGITEEAVDAFYKSTDNYIELSVDEYINIAVSESDERYPALTYFWYEYYDDEGIEGGDSSKLRVPAADGTYHCLIKEEGTDNAQTIAFSVKTNDHDADDIVSISFERNGNDYIVLDEYTRGETANSFSGYYFKYLQPILGHGDKITLHKGGGDEVYEYKDDRYDFDYYRHDWRRFEGYDLDGNIKVINLSEMYWGSNQSYDHQWKTGDSLGEDYYTMSINGCECTIPVLINPSTITANKIEFHRDGSNSFDLNSSWNHSGSYYDEDGEQHLYTIYDLNGHLFNTNDELIIDGRVFVHKYENATGGAFGQVYGYFINEESGERFAAAAVQFDAVQTEDDPWLETDTHRTCTISIFGASCTVPALCYPTGIITVQEVPATCTATGVKKHWERSDDGTLYLDSLGNVPVSEEDLVIPMTDHSWYDFKVEKQPTAEEPGVMIKRCQNCSETKSEAIPAIDPDHIHNIEHVDAVAPTCSSNGNAEYWYCGDCGRYFSDEECSTMTTYKQLELSKDSSAHEYSAYRAMDEYEHYSICKNCSAYKRGKHSFGSGEITTEPTYTEKGIRTYTCKYCGYKKTEEIPRLDDPEAGYGLAQLPDANKIPELILGERINITDLAGDEAQTYYFYAPQNSEMRYDLMIRSVNQDGRVNDVTSADVCIFTDEERIGRYDGGASEVQFDKDCKYYVQFRYSYVPFNGGSEYYLCLEKHDYSLGAEIPENAEELALDQDFVTKAHENNVVTYKFIPSTSGSVTFKIVSDGTSDELEAVVFRDGIESVASILDDSNSLEFTADLVADKTYYLQFRRNYGNFEGDDPNVTVRLEEYKEPPLAEIDPECSEITPNTETPVKISKAGEVVTYKFTPKIDSELTFESLGSKDTVGAICLEDRSLVTNDDGDNGNNFKASISAKAGVTYYFQSKFYSSNSTGSFNVKLTQIIPEHDHVAGESVKENEVAPTCEEEGGYDEVVRCTLCNEIISSSHVILPATGHKWGAISYEWPESLTCDDETVAVTATRICENDSNHIDTHTVNAVYSIEVPASLESAGVGRWTASFDGDLGSDSRTVEIPKITHAHVYQKVEAVEPSCVEPGNIEYYICTEPDCGKFFIQDSEGNMTEVTEDETVLGVIPHKLTEQPAIDPTCTESGRSKYWVCDVCGKKFADQDGMEIIDQPEVIPAHGHSWGDAVYETDAGKSNVTASHMCTVCGAEESETVDVTSTVERASCETEGRIIYTSAAFTKDFEVWTSEESIPATGHMWNEPVYRWSADNRTVTAMHSCANDPDHSETEEVSAAITSTKEATETEEGCIVWTSFAFTNDAFSVQTKEEMIPKVVTVEEGEKYAKETLDTADDEIAKAQTSSSDALTAAEELGETASETEITAAVDKAEAALSDAQTAVEAADAAYEAAQAYNNAAQKAYDEATGGGTQKLQSLMKLFSLKAPAAAEVNEAEETASETADPAEVLADSREKLAAAKYNKAAANNTLAKSKEAYAKIASVKTKQAVEKAKEVAANAEASEAEKAAAANAAKEAAAEAVEHARSAEEAAADTERLVAVAKAYVEETEADPGEGKDVSALETETAGITDEATQERIKAEKAQLTAEEMATVSDARNAVETAKKLADDAKIAVQNAQTAQSEYQAAAAAAKALADSAAATRTAADISNAANAAAAAAAKKAAAEKAINDANNALTAAKEAAADAESKIDAASLLEDMAEAKGKLSDALSANSVTGTDLAAVESAKGSSNGIYNSAKSTADSVAAAEAARQGEYDSSLPKIKSVKKSKVKKTSITVKWKKLTKKQIKKSKATKIEIWVCPNTGFGPDTKIYTVSKSKSSKACKGLTKNTKYYVKVRAIKYVNGVKHVGPWSARKAIKTKKK